MHWLKQSTSITIRIGPFVDSTDGVTAEAALTISQADIRLSKNGGAFAQTSDAGGATHDENGWYSLTLDATDTNTLGRLDVAIAESGALPVWREYMVLEADAYDALCATAGTGHIEADAVQISGDATAANNAELDYDGTGYAKANSTIGTTTTNTDMRGTDNAALASVLGALADAAAAGDPTSADTVMQYVKQLINILIGTTGIVTFPAESAPANNVSLAEVIRAIHVDVTGLNGDAMRGTNGANTTTPPTAAAIVNEWETQSQADPTGFHVNVQEIGDTPQTANDNGADINAILADTNELQTDDVPGLIAALNDLSAANVNTEVLDVLNTDTFAEPGQGAPGATISLVAKIGYLFKFARNKIIQDATTLEIYNDAGDTVDQKATVSDDGTDYTRGEIGSGP